MKNCSVEEIKSNFDSMTKEEKLREIMKMEIMLALEI